MITVINQDSPQAMRGGGGVFSLLTVLYHTYWSSEVVGVSAVVNEISLAVQNHDQRVQLGLQMVLE